MEGKREEMLVGKDLMQLMGEGKEERGQRRGQCSGYT